MKWKQVPWVNKGIQNLIKIRDTIHRKYLRQKSTFWFNRFKYYRNMIKKLIFSSKKNYYKNYFEKHESNSKKNWTGIGEIVFKNLKPNPTKFTLPKMVIHTLIHYRFQIDSTNFTHQ